MMLHARGGVGELISTDINTLVEEAVNLAYHGIRATHISFNVTFVKNYHPSRLELNVVQQEISRVLLNLLNNAMYAVRSATAAVPVQPLLGENDSPAAPLRATDYEPTIWITTKAHKDRIEIRIRDNGPGIPDEIQQKIFQPFFTTKPTGEGTGLGLSMSYDIIVNGHGGSLTCSSNGEGAEFVVSLPARVARIG
jgi:signal transduction histidine kinase